MFQRFWRFLTAFSSAGLVLFAPFTGQAAEPVTQNVVQTYSDLVDLSESSPLVILAQIQAVIRLDGDRARSATPGMERVYVEASGVEALNGVIPAGQQLRYLADVPVDARGKVANWKKQRVVLFARPVVGGNGEIQLVAGDAQIVWSPALDAKLRPILAELSAPARPPRITGVSMALYQAGDLAGEGETQIFLTTATGTPAAIIVQHRNGAPPNWSMTLSEVVDTSGRPPAHDTLVWYRLACNLPESLPSAANVGETQEAKDHALGDYLLVRRDLGACARTRAR